MKKILRMASVMLLLCGTLFVSCKKNNDDSAKSPEYITGDENGHHYANLGLNVNWATRNLGATSPEEYGGYYVWDKIAPAVEEWGGKWRMPTIDEQRELLNNCCWVWTEGYNGSAAKGFVVYAAKTDADKRKLVFDEKLASSYKLSDAHIFLPMAGYHYGANSAGEGSGFYWSAASDTEDEFYAYSMDFGFDGIDFYGVDGSICHMQGQSVRLVFGD